jgi:hypothetical protein
MRLHLLLMAAASLLLTAPFQGCKTEDVLPTVSLQASVTDFDFTRGTAQVRARLNGPINRELKLKLRFAGTAVRNTHYAVSAAEITIASGSDSGFITLSGIPNADTTIRTIEVSLEASEEAVPVPPSSVLIRLVNCSGDRDGDGITDCDDACPDEAGPAANNGCPWLGLIVNEVLYDPPADAAGDANGDGTRDPLADEFVEIFNSNPALDISGYTLSDASSLRHTFPAGTIVPSKGVIVVFGGGTPTGSFGGALVQTASEGQLNLNNAGDMLTLKDTQGNTVAVFDINGLSGNPDESYTRNPDITGAFEQHARIPAAKGAAFSPGLKLDGTRF